MGTFTETKPLDPAFPTQDVRSAAVVYDTAGSVQAAVAMGGLVNNRTLSGIDVALGRYSFATGACHGGSALIAYTGATGVPDGDFQVQAKSLGLKPAVAIAGNAITARLDSPLLAAKSWNCAAIFSYGPEIQGDDFVYHDQTETIPLFPNTAPGKQPRCAPRTKRVRRGGTVVLRCARAAGPLTVRFYQSDRLKGTKATRVRGRGGAAVNTRGLRQGAYHGDRLEGRHPDRQGAAAGALAARRASRSARGAAPSGRDGGFPTAARR